MFLFLLHFNDYLKLKKTQINGKIIYAHGLEGYYPNNMEKIHITQSNLHIQCNPYQKSNGIFHKMIIIRNHKMYMEPQKTPIVKAKLRNKNKPRCITLPDFKLYHKTIVVKTVYGTGIKTHRSMEHNKSKEINPCIYG